VFSFFVRFVMVVLVGVAAYCFWPRAGSLGAFEPDRMARLQVEARRLEDGKKKEALFVIYRIFEGQYGIPPLSAAPAAWHFSEALTLFDEAADHADGERALPFLERTFSILKEKTDGLFDASVVARLELYAWLLARDRGKQSQLAAVLSEQLALVHGGSARIYDSVAVDFARARRLAAARQWGAAMDAETVAWRRLRGMLDRSSQAESPLSGQEKTTAPPGALD
jgi:hypothetical protein